jgi:hypothetical protein
VCGGLRECTQNGPHRKIAEEGSPQRKSQHLVFSVVLVRRCYHLTTKYSPAWFFSYTLKLFRKGLKRDLEEHDLYEVLTNYRSKQLGDQLEAEWEKQKKKGPNNSIFRLLWTCYGWEYFLLGLTQLTIKTILM